MDLATELQRIYESQINVRIGWFWDCGIEVRLGDMNDFLTEESVPSIAGSAAVAAGNYRALLSRLDLRQDARS